MKRSFMYISFVLFLLFTGCEKTVIPKYENYFSGKINGKSFWPSWALIACPEFDGSYEPGQQLRLEINDCDQYQQLTIQKTLETDIGVYTSPGTSGDAAWCRFEDNKVVENPPGGPPIYLDANFCEEIRLEITNVHYISREDKYFIEGLLDAVVKDTILNRTFVVSDVNFGYKF